MMEELKPSFKPELGTFSKFVEYVLSLIQVKSGVQIWVSSSSKKYLGFPVYAGLLPK